MLRLPGSFVALLALSIFATAQTPQQEPGPVVPANRAGQSAAAAKCQVTQAREVGLVKLVKMSCDENKLSLEVWLPPREPAPWLMKDISVTVIPTITAPDVHVSPGRAPRSDYMRPKPVHLQIIGGPRQKLVAMLVSMTFH
jgi:hypothetical protein